MAGQALAQQKQEQQGKKTDSTATTDYTNTLPSTQLNKMTTKQQARDKQHRANARSRTLSIAAFRKSTSPCCVVPTGMLPTNSSTWLFICGVWVEATPSPPPTAPGQMTRCRYIIVRIVYLPTTPKEELWKIFLKKRKILRAKPVS